MKSIVAFLSSLICILLFVSGCERESQFVPRNYNDYIQVKLMPINNSQSDTIYKIQISNSLNAVFEKKCELIYTLTNTSLNKTYTAKKALINKKVPSDPGLGYLNLQGGGLFNEISNLSSIGWMNFDFKSLDKGSYDLRITLFIDDPISPNNSVNSDWVKYIQE
jgi:hypothetical protein